MSEITGTFLEEAESPYKTKSETWSSHDVIFCWLTGMKTGAHGLDVGTATGIFGAACGRAGLSVDGIEPNEAWARKASPYYHRIHACGVEQVPEELLRGYDFIILGDVLEHMLDPLAVLCHLVTLQDEDCLFLISVPNVANIWVRLNLLLGRFNYGERGLLDRTHLHFYTWKTLQEFLRQADLEVLERKVTPIPLPQVSPFFQKTLPGRLIYQGLHLLTMLLPRLLGYQFVVKAVRRGITARSSQSGGEPAPHSAEEQ